eukprot:4519283-Prymnesium_polylepis.2
MVERLGNALAATWRASSQNASSGVTPTNQYRAVSYCQCGPIGAVYDRSARATTTSSKRKPCATCRQHDDGVRAGQGPAGGQAGGP